MSDDDSRPSELKPCPFCGAEVIVRQVEQGRAWSGGCEMGGCFDMGYSSTREQAMEAMNQRMEPHEESNEGRDARAGKA